MSILAVAEVERKLLCFSNRFDYKNSYIVIEMKDCQEDYATLLDKAQKRFHLHREYIVLEDLNIRVVSLLFLH